LEWDGFRDFQEEMRGKSGEMREKTGIYACVEIARVWEDGVCGGKA
jgi:hypothetical protein